MTFTEAENAYLASQRLGRRPHRPRRQPPGHAGRLLLQPQAGHDRRDRLHHGHEPEVPQRRVKGPGVGTITFGELLTHRAGFRLDSGLIFETDDAAREQIRQGVQQVDQRVADYNNINFTIFKDMLPLMEGLPGGASRARRSRGPLLPQLCSASGIRSKWVSPTPGARPSAMPCPCTRRPAPGPHGAGRPRWDRRRAWKGMVYEAAWC
jgi:hypothetical protein